jgi:hypothetical protein
MSGIVPTPMNAREFYFCEECGLIDFELTEEEAKEVISALDRAKIDLYNIQFRELIREFTINDACKLATGIKKKNKHLLREALRRDLKSYYRLLSVLGI